MLRFLLGTSLVRGDLRFDTFGAAAATVGAATGNATARRRAAWTRRPPDMYWHGALGTVFAAAAVPAGFAGVAAGPA